MTTREDYNRGVRKRLKMLSAKFGELYEAKVQEFDSAFSGSVSWLQGIVQTVTTESDLDRYEFPFFFVSLWVLFCIEI